MITYKQKYVLFVWEYMWENQPFMGIYEYAYVMYVQHYMYIHTYTACEQM